MTPPTEPVQLWQVGTKRCVITPVTADPPYRVSVFDGDTLISEHESGTHNEAVWHAVEQLRLASPRIGC